MIEIKKIWPTIGIYLVSISFFLWVMNAKSDFLFGHVVEGFIFLGFLFLIVLIHLFIFDSLKEKIMWGFIDLIPLLGFVIFGSLDSGSFGLSVLIIIFYFLLPLITMVILNWIITKIWNKIKTKAKSK